MSRTVTAILLLCSAGVAIALGPLAVPDYQWLSQSVSETAAQNTPGAWVARTAFPLLAVALLTLMPGTSWGAASTAGYYAFAAGLLAVGVWSHEPYLPGRTFDPTEATLHSVAATAMGVAIINAEVFAAWHTRAWSRLATPAAYVLLSVAMVVHPGWSGVYQRALFLTLISQLTWYAWAGRRATRGDPGAAGQDRTARAD